MIKSILHKGFSVLLTCLVLFSTVSITIEERFCGDALVDVSMFLENETCGIDALDVLLNNSCCKDELNVVKGQDELSYSSFEDLDLLLQTEITTQSDIVSNHLKGLAQYNIPHKNYAPPILVANIRVLSQVFII